MVQGRKQKQCVSMLHLVCKHRILQKELGRRRGRNGDIGGVCYVGMNVREEIIW